MASKTIFGNCRVKLWDTRCAAYCKEEHDGLKRMQDQTLESVLSKMPAAAEALKDADTVRRQLKMPMNTTKEVKEIEWQI